MKGGKSGMDSDTIFFILAIAFIVLVPAIPGVILFLWLQPVTFWQKLAWFIVSTILYVIVLDIILRLTS